MVSDDSPNSPIDTNPLSAARTDSALPAFDRIRPEDAEPAVDAILARNRQELQALLAALDGAREPLTWRSLVEPLEDMGDELGRAWGPVVHLFAVTSTPAWRAAHAACLPKVTQYHVELSQNDGLFRSYERLAKEAGFAEEAPARHKVVRDALRDFRLSGIGLPHEARARFGAIALSLSKLESKFQENVIDSVQAWSKRVTDETALAGMTPESKSAARAKARAKGHDGFLLTLDFPSYDAVVTHAEDRALRQELYEAYATRASDQGKLAGLFDNGPLMAEILALRHEQARLLGFRNFAEVSLESKMARSTDEVERFLLELNERARPRALEELGGLRSFARARDGLADLQVWDVPYYAEKLKERDLGFAEEELRPYFEVTHVLRGLFALVERLYDLRVEDARGIPTWHPDVKTYRIRDADGAEVGVFYLDLYVRDDKRGGAWMDECVSRRRRGHPRNPAAYLTCNFVPPPSGGPALLLHDEVITLFHEFGHGLHHLLTRVDEQGVSGIRGVEWDAVELPSQFMENWCYDRPTLRTFARHWQTHEPLPDHLVEKLRASRTFHAGLATVRQLEFALFDLRLHRDHASGASVQDILTRTRSEVSVLPLPSWNRMPNSFSHIFGGGYAAGYYSYKWAEVLSADAFSAFVESGFAPETARRFRDTILAAGGSRPAMELFASFRGRPPNIEALLKQSGLMP
jgi:oligopeptidase A